MEKGKQKNKKTRYAQILSLLERRPMFVGEIVVRLGIHYSQCSAALSLLKSRKKVISFKAGRLVTYSLRK